MLERGHSGERIHLFRILQITVDPFVVPSIGNSGKVWAHSAAFSLISMTLAATFTEEELFAIVGYGTSCNKLSN
jgi:hypothetical protein